jgi:hypothetical protein
VFPSASAVSAAVISSTSRARNTARCVGVSASEAQRNAQEADSCNEIDSSARRSSATGAGSHGPT